ncbi:MAG: hypothetical protein HPY73_08040 [Methanomassiliicoccales archaeon]|nr:MAG: hypothetical protein HPY73_08040 [Methanomassiliicoccales archaeon]
MKNNKLVERLERAKDVIEIFEVVKEAARDSRFGSRAGLMLGLADLGGGDGHWIGGLYPIASNVIVLNRKPLSIIKVSRPEIYRSYVFHVLLHEYIHALGVTDEDETRSIAYRITKEQFGDGHLATAMAKDITSILPYITYPGQRDMIDDPSFELVKGFDRSSTDRYIY